MTIFNCHAQALAQDLMELYPEGFQQAANAGQIATFLQEKADLVCVEDLSLSLTSFNTGKAWIDGLTDKQITAIEEAGDFRLSVSYAISA